MSASHGRDVANVLGCPIDRLGMDATVERCEALIKDAHFAQQISINAAKLVALRKDPRLREFVTGCRVISADGQAVVWASHLLGDPLPERVAGIDLMDRLCEVAANRGYGVFFLGATREVLEEALDAIIDRHPTLNIVGRSHGYFRPDEEDALREHIRGARADILFVAMSSPRKEYWLAEHGDRLGVPFVMGIGGSLDVLAGRVARAPRWAQRLGLEWLFRTAQEPRRLWRRYLVSNAVFLGLVMQELTRTRLAR